MDSVTGPLMARLLQVELGLVGVVGPLRDVGGVERVELGHRVVVADLAVAAQDLVDHLLAIDAVFEREAQVVVVEGRRVARIGKV